MSKQAIIIFTKYPEPGKVKKRLAKSIGMQKAFAVYHFLLKNILEQAQKNNADKFLFIDRQNNNNIAHPAFAPYGFQEYKQQGAHLGEKMANAFRLIFEQGYTQILLVGSDIYELNNALFEQAFVALQRVDVVLAPANDGGYYLIGMNRLHTSLFRFEKWSHSKVFSDTVNKIKQEKLTCFILPKRIDIDTVEDLRLCGFMGQHKKTEI